MDQLMENIRKFIPKWLMSRITQLYIFSMLMIFPFFYTDKMFHLFLDKRNFFLVASILYICTIFPAAMLALYDWGNDMHAPKNPDIIFALILVSAFIISTVFSLNPEKTIFEMTSRTVSGLCYLFCMLTFFAIRQYGKVDKILLWVWLAGSAGLYLFGILCACGINVLHIQDGLVREQIPIYLTPLSNTNYNTCYVCLMLPPIMVTYMICKEQLSQRLCGVNLYLGFMFTLFIKTESASIAIIFALLLLGYFALETESWSNRYIQMVAIYLGAKLTIHILLNLFPRSLHPFHGLGLLLLDNIVLLCEILFCAAFYLLWQKKQYIIRKKLASARKALVIIGASAACACALCILFANINAANLSKGSFLRHLVVTDKTFNGRGYIWIRTIDTLKDEPIFRKFLGNGLNSFRDVMQITSTISSESTFADPHNEIMQMAMDMGVLGLIGYFGLLISSLVRGLRNWRKDPLWIAAVLTLSTYMLQSLANEYSIYTLPLLFIFLGLVNRIEKQSDK